MSVTNPFTSQLPLLMELSNIHAVSVLGRGAKGVVFLVHSDSQPLAFKAISRSSIEKKNNTVKADHEAGGNSSGDAYRRIWFERDVLLALKHPLLPSLHGVVVTDKIVGFLMDNCSGGDLNSLRRKQTESMFSDEIIRFYAAELVIVLEHLHNLGIVYRDLKPENILIQSNGHLMLIDFDLSVKLPTKPPTPLNSSTKPEPHPHPTKKKKRNYFACFSTNCGVSPDIPPEERIKTEEDSSTKSNSFVGTEDYVAPEIIKGEGHDFAVDWWSLGVVLYEMLYGKTPFRGANRKETFYRILTKMPELVGEKTALRDLIGRLLEKEGDRRIGVEEIKRHQFFKRVDWESLLTVERPPFIPLGVDLEFEDMERIDVENFVEDVHGNGNAEPGKEESNVERVKNHEKNGEFGVF